MLFTHRSLVRAHQPTFKQSGNTVDARHADVGRISGIRQNNSLMSVTELRQFVVAAPSIGKDLRALFGNVTNERHKTAARYIRNSAHSYPSEPLRRMNFNRDNRNLFPFTAATSFATYTTAADIGLIHFDAPRELIPPSAHHGGPHFMQPCPCGLITPQPKNAFQTQSTRTVFLTGHKPHRSKPRSQGHSCTLKDSAGRYRGLSSTLPTMKITPSCCPWLCFTSALSTFKSIRPAAMRNIAAACQFIGKPFQKFLICARIVLSRCRMRTIVHTATYYMLGALASSGYPLLLIPAKKKKSFN